RRGAAAEEDRHHLVRRRERRLALEVGGEGGFPPRRVDVLADMAVEVAIGAFRPAERPVDIDRQRRGHRRGSSAAASFSKARARWLMRSLSAGSISPKVSV